jgi:hypothetical protein
MLINFINPLKSRVPQVSILRPGNPSRWSRIAGPAVILLAAAVAVVPQVVYGPSCGHDFDFHLASWFDCAASWREGILYPRWDAIANHGAGEPRFIFYPPLTWMLGAALGAVLPWTIVPLAMVFLILAGTGLATRALARLMLPDGAATLAGCAAIFSGYALFNAYERSAFAEFAGGVWIPLVLLFILRERYPSHPFRIERGMDGAQSAPVPINGVPVEVRGIPPLAQKQERAKDGAPSLLADSLVRRALDGSAAPLALAVAGCWLSNPTVGVMAGYLLAAVALTLAVTERSWAPLLRALVGGALGMGVIAAYLVPATWEQRWVDILQVTRDPGQTLENSWLFATHADPVLADHDVVLRQASIIVVGMIAVALAGMLVAWRRGVFLVLPTNQSRRSVPHPFAFFANGWETLQANPRSRLWLPLALVPFAVLFLQFPLSRPVWNLLPELRFLQFPWRWLLVLEAPMAIFFIAAVWPRPSARRWRRIVVVSACIALFVGMTACAQHYFFQNCYAEDTVPGMLDSYRAGHGFPGTDEYEPIGSDLSLIPTGLPAACLVSDPNTALGKAAESPDLPPAWEAAQGGCRATYAWAATLGQAPHRHLRITATVDHPGYLVLRLLSFPAWQIKVNAREQASLPHRDDGLIVVPVAQGPVEVTADWRTTPDVLAGRWLSAIFALLLLALFLLERRLKNPARPHISSK